MLTGKYWLTPITLHDTTATEHAIAARNHMLGLARTDPIFSKGPFYNLTAKDAARLTRSKYAPVVEAVKYLRGGGDPRWFTIQHHNWIRVAKSTFNVWNLNQWTHARIKGDYGYWCTQKNIEPGDVVDIVELMSGKLFSVPVKVLRGRGRIETIKRKYEKKNPAISIGKL